MLISILVCGILAVGVVALYFYSRAKDVKPLAEAVVVRDQKVDALEAAASAKRQEEHDKNVQEAKELAARGDVRLAVEWLRDSVRKSK